jgi:hypothetical protein
MYTEDATYGWNVGPNDEFMAVGRDQIREYAVGLEMEGLGGWTYPYMRILIDDVQGEILGLWKQVADATRPDGSHYEIAGLGGSWFRYAGDFRWSWQRDFFDVGNATAAYIEMIQASALSPGMTARIEKMASGRQPGHYPVGQAPVGLWEGVEPTVLGDRCPPPSRPAGRPGPWNPTTDPAGSPRPRP